jgi:hypothetical protein
VIVQEVLTRIIDAINVHLKYYASNGKGGRGFIISKLFSSLLEWIMVIEPIVLTETDLCQLVFDVIELALQSNLDEPVQQKKEMNNGAPFKFKLLSEKRPFIHQDLINNSSGVSDMHENDQGYVKVRHLFYIPFC